LDATFPKGTLESDHEDLLKTTAEIVTDPKALSGCIAMITVTNSQLITADRLYIWKFDDHSDGSAFWVFTGGTPRTITWTHVIVYDK
jgi:hypothetical protein